MTLRSTHTTLALLVLIGLAVACQDPSQPDQARGNVLRNQGRYEEALAAYRKGLEKSPNRTVLRLRIAETYLDMGRLEEAERAYREVLERSPDDEAALEAAFLGLAQIADSRGQNEEARKWLTSVLERNPENLYARMSRANLRLSAGKAEAAVEDYARAVEQDRTNKAALYGYGAALLAAGDAKNARTAFERLEQLDGDSPLGAYGLARLAAKEGKADEALRLLGEALRRAKQKGVPLDPKEVAGDDFLASLRDRTDFDRLLGEMRAHTAALEAERARKEAELEARRAEARRQAGEEPEKK